MSINYWANWCAELGINSKRLNPLSKGIFGRGQSIDFIRAFLGLACSILLTNNSYSQVSVAGSPSVSDGGAAAYSVPISVPPGVGGMEPKLAISYNSQAGNGLLGLGWSIDGMSSIARCPLTKAQDGQNRGIAWDNSDGYCLDGERMFPVSAPGSGGAAAGSNGGNGTYYRLERDSFSSIQSFVFLGNSGPAYFIVKTKSGLTLEYGLDANSRINARGRSEVRAWALNKATDSKGNYYSIGYISDANNGQSYPSRIDYTGNSLASPAVTPNNYVLFDYGVSDRPDAQTGYIAGSLIKTTKRLQAIRIYSSGGLVMQYSLTYTTSASSGQSQLVQIDPVSASGASLLPVKVTWSAGTKSLVDMGNAGGSAYGDWDENPERFRVMDLDGDGKQDIIAGPQSDGRWFWMQSTGNGLVDRGSVVSGAYGDQRDVTYRIRSMDIDGDGLQDIVIGPNSSGQWFWLQSTGYSLVNRGLLIANAYSSMSTSSAASRVWVMDVDNDGRQDIVLGPDANGKWYWLQSTGYSFVDRGAVIAGAYGNWDGSASRIRMMDLDGDGRQDFVIGPGATGGWYWLRGTGSGFQDKGALLSGAYANWETVGHRIRVADVNGDGLPDIVLGPSINGDWFWLQSTGSGLLDRGKIGSGMYSGWTAESSAIRIRVNDINSDQRLDYLLGPDAAGKWYSVRSTGEAFVDDGSIVCCAYSQWSLSSNPQRIFMMDINGDGASDVVFGPDGGGNWYWMSATTRPEVVVSVTNTNVLDSTTFSYAFLTNQAVYTKDIPFPTAAATYPKLDVQPPLSVVSELKQSNGLGGFNTTSYTYGGLKAEVGTGRGMLGFRWVKSKELVTGVESYTEYYQNFPYTGTPKLSETRLAGAGNAGVLKRTATTAACQNPQTASACTVAIGNRYFPYASLVEETSWDLNGTAFPGVSSSYVYGVDPVDGKPYGDPTQITVTNQGDNSSKTTVNEYWPANTGSGNWILGRLKKATVTSVKP